jgi:AraC-like DNA-binding protein/catechol 2,3-dioxygenase-like lactoylglutathione lyase family enzyme
MDRAYAEPLDVRAVAAIAHVSEAHFIRTFRAVFGETPHRYLQRRRVERSMFLLRETDRSVTDICFDIGFTSLGTFLPRDRRRVAVDVSTGSRADRRAPLRPTRGDATARSGRPDVENEQFWRSHGRPGGLASELPDRLAQENEHMITRLNVASIYVLDKDEALDFYVNKLGLEKGNDVKQGDYRWLTIRVPGDQPTEVSLEQPGPPLHDEGTAEQLRELIAKGALGGLVFVTDDARALYETLKERGVTDFTQEPTDHFYGTDMGLRDPFGNPIRILQQGKVAQKATA